MPLDLPAILIVDDESAQRELLAGFLQSRGLPTRQAASGEEALEVIRGQPPGIRL